MYSIIWITLYVFYHLIPNKCILQSESRWINSIIWIHSKIWIIMNAFYNLILFECTLQSELYWMYFTINSIIWMLSTILFKMNVLYNECILQSGSVWIYSTIWFKINVFHHLNQSECILCLNQSEIHSEPKCITQSESISMYSLMLLSGLPGRVPVHTPWGYKINEPERNVENTHESLDGL